MTADEVFKEVKSTAHLLHVRKDVHPGAAFLHFSTYIWANDYQEEHELSGLTVGGRMCGLKKPRRKLRTAPLHPTLVSASSQFPSPFGGYPPHQLSSSKKGEDILRMDFFFWK